MNKSKIVAILAISLPCYLAAAEPSAFGAGDLSSPNPYGLTKTESTILETKKDLQKIATKSNNQANQVDSLRERIDGLQTIVESISTSTHSNKIQLKSLEEKNSIEHKNINEYNKRLTESVETNSKNIEEIKLLLTEISKLIDSINESYVSKTEFEKLVSDVNKLKDPKQSSKAKPPKEEALSNADIEKEAAQAYKEKEYTKAIDKYKHLVAQNYKPAKSHYMLGEIEYYRKNYAEAVANFKKSATLNDKAEYMPVLLLHTAVSMDELGDKDNAQNFYSAVVDKFPQSGEAKIARKKLKK
ncbi:MAG: hypothetical protein QG559_441 [Campylobacterota bacterium]|nr:hypothetical protein [Campylobacterota bacterium]